MKRVILEELVEAGREGDRSRFDRLFDMWFAAVYALTLRRVGGDRRKAEQLTRRLLIGCMRFALTPPAARPMSVESTKSQRGRAELY